MVVRDVIGGRYDLTQRIGSGGMAQVFLATDRLLRRQVAIKILGSETAADPVFVERFRREAQAVAQLNHPNVVSVYDWGQANPKEDGDPTIYYMVMEFVAGENLKQRLRDGAIPEADSLDIAAQIAAALEVAHRHGVIHRDIKPQNVLLAPFGMVKVVDFGIAHTAGVTQLTRTNAVAGTAHYLSPEQAQSRPVDNRSDLYSLGVVLFEMLTGRELFQGRTLIEIAMHHVHDPPPRPTSLQPNISSETEVIVLRALAKDPAKRFQNATEMRAALLEARSDLLIKSAEPKQERTVAAPLAEPGPAGQGTDNRTRRRVAGEWRSTSSATRGKDESRWTARLPMAVPALLLLLVGLPAFAMWQANHGSNGTPQRPTVGALSSTNRHGTQRPKSVHVRGRAGPATRTPPTASVAASTNPTPTIVAASPTPNSVPTPLPTRGPSIAALQQPQVAPDTAAGSSSPAGAVSNFYRLISAGNLTGAVSMETANMKRAWPPESAILERFGQTQQIRIQSPQVLSNSGTVATVSVSGFDQEKSGSPRSDQNFYLVWTLVKKDHGWMLDSVSS